MLECFSRGSWKRQKVYRETGKNRVEEVAEHGKLTNGVRMKN